VETVWKRCLKLLVYFTTLFQELDYTALMKWMMMNWEGFGTKRSGPNFKVLSRHYPGEVRKITKSLSQDGRPPHIDLNPRPLQYEAQALKALNMVFSVTVYLSAPKSVIKICNLHRLTKRDTGRAARMLALFFFTSLNYGVQSLLGCTAMSHHSDDGGSTYL